MHNGEYGDFPGPNQVEPHVPKEKATTMKTPFVRAVLAIVAYESPIAPISCATPEPVLMIPGHTVKQTFCFTDTNMDDTPHHAVNVLVPGIAHATVSGTDRVAVTSLKEGITTMEIAPRTPAARPARVRL